MSRSVVILGIYVTDLTFRAERMPLLGETIAGSAFAMGPGGKGSNQAVAAARAGADVIFCTRLGARCVRRHRALDVGRGRHHGAGDNNGRRGDRRGAYLC